MEQIFKWTFITLAIIFGIYVCNVENPFFHTFPKYVDDIAIIVTNIAIIIYLVLKNTNIMTIGKLKKLSSDTILEYKTVVDINTNAIKDIYVRPITWFTPSFWKKLDYRYTINLDNCRESNARFFTTKMKQVATLLNYMEKKRLTNKGFYNANMDNLKNDLTLVIIPICFVLFFYFAYNLSK